MKFWYYIGRGAGLIIDTIAEVLDGWESAFYRGLDGKQIIEDEEVK